jgi:uroporphyrinogen-III synthase
MAPGYPLTDQRVLIPRGGDLGARLADAVTARGGQPIIAPVIRFATPVNSQAVSDACAQLSGGAFDWVAVTSATTVETLVKHGVRIPDVTRVAVVGPATGDAMTTAGFRVDFMPSATFSAEAMVAEWPDSGGTVRTETVRTETVLLPQSAIAEPTLADGLTARGLEVTTVAAYDTAAIDWDDDIRHRLASGQFSAVLLTSASVARAIAGQGVPLPAATVVACIGDSTAAGARAAGLPVHAVAAASTAEGLVASLSDYLTSVEQQPTRTEMTP